MTARLAFVDRLGTALRARGFRGFEPPIDRSEIYAFEDWWEAPFQCATARAQSDLGIDIDDAIAISEQVEV